MQRRTRIAEKQKERRLSWRRSDCSVARSGLLGFRLRLQLLDLLALILDFLLLRLHLRLGLCVGVLRILHRIADYVAGSTAEHTTDCRARERMAYGRTHDCASTCAESGAAESTLFTSRKRLPRASCKNERSRQRQTHDCCYTFAHKENLHVPMTIRQPSYSVSCWPF